VSTSVRLVLLWVSQVARVLVDGCLRLVAMLEYAGGEGGLSAWHLATAVFVAPFVLLAPLNGCVSNALPRRRVLAGSAAFSLAAVVACAGLQWPWLWCVAFVALGAALNSSTRYAMLPAAARDAGLALPRLSAWIELGAAAAVVSSVALGFLLPQKGWPGTGEPLAPGSVGVLVGLNLLCLLGALPASFPSDVRRSEPPARAVRGFFRDAGRIVRHRSAGPSLLALAGFQALVTAGAGPLVARALEQGDGLKGLMSALILAGVGTALGSAAASLVGHPQRSLGLVPLGASGLLGALCWAFAVLPEGIPQLPCLLLGFMGGLLNAPLRAAYLGAVRADARGNATAVMNTAVYAATAILCGALVGLSEAGALTTPLGQLLLLSALAGMGALAAWAVLVVPFRELCCVFILSPFYRVGAHGPGMDRIPASGPLLVVANRDSRLDPFWLAKVSPRRLTPMRGVSSGEAVERLDRGEAVVVLPELSGGRGSCRAERGARGALLFLEGQALGSAGASPSRWMRPFGEEIGHILRDRPHTPVVACWIESGIAWEGGLDRRKPIDVAVAEPEVLPAEVVNDPRRAGEHLGRACLACRRFLGLPGTGLQPVPREAGGAS
jgi:hypothetical protein